MKNDTVSKELQYQELIADVQKAYLSESRELRWCKECKEINLWAYWQGRGHLDADIMLVGQDWGCPWDTPSVATMKNVCDMNCGKVVSYMRRNDSITDKNLIQLFRTIGFDILSEIVLYQSRNGLQIARNERRFQSNLGQCRCPILSQIG